MGPEVALGRNPCPGDMFGSHDQVTDLNSPGMPQKTKAIDWDSIPCAHDSFVSFPQAIQKFAELEPDCVCNAWLNKECRVVKSFTRAQLWQYSGNVARMLVRDHRVQRGDRLMIVFPFGIDWVVAFLACLRIGAVVVSVYPPNPQRLAQDVPKFAHFVKDCGSTLALTVTEYKQLVTATSLYRKWPAGLQWIAIDPFFVPSSDGPASFQSFDVAIEPSDAALIQYTSGSTGNPKGIVISHTNIFHQISYHIGKCLWAALPAGAGTLKEGRYVGWAPQYHDMGLFAVLGAIGNGMDTAYTFSPLDWLQSPTMWPRAIEKFRGTLTTGQNFALELTCKRLRELGESYDCSSIGMAVIGGEPTRLEALRDAAAIMRIPFHALQNTWGLAEHCVGVSSHGSLALGESVSCSLAFSRACGADVRVAADPAQHAAQDRPDADAAVTLRQVQPGELGEVCVRSDSVALGYWNQPELSERTFRARIHGCEGRYLRTGDLGCVVGDQFFVLSRLKDLIIVQGRNFAPSDLEATAEKAFAALRPGSSVAFQSEGLGVVLVCELRSVHQDQLSADTLAEQIQGAVEREHGLTVDRVLIVPQRAVPKTTSGKVQRSKTAEMVREGRLAQLAAAAHAEGTRSLATCGSMREMLEAVGVEDWGATLGANGVASLQISRLLHAADERLGVQLDWAAVAECSAEELCERAREGAGGGGAGATLLVCAEEEVEAPRRWVRVARQLVVLGACLLCVAAATLPAVALVEESFNAGSPWWLSNGRGGPLVLAAVVVWMGAYSAVCVLAKWGLVGRRRRGAFCALWSWSFTRWMVVERLLGVWEFTVGRFVVGTPWLNLFYSLLGARVSWDARLDSFCRDCDMLRVGPRAHVAGKLYGRVFTASGVHFGPLELGAAVSVGGATVVQPFSTVGDGVTLEPGSVVPAHTDLNEPGSVWHGNPCRLKAGGESEGDAAEASRPASASDSGQPAAMTRAMFPLLFAALSASSVAVLNRCIPEVEWGDPFSPQLLWLSTSYLLVFGLTGLLLFAFTVLLKWSFASPWTTDRLATTVAVTFFPWLEKTFLVAYWHRAFGMALGKHTVVVYSHLCSPSSAHLVQLGAHSVAFNGALSPAKPPSLWSWLRGRTAAPWRWQARDIDIGKGVGLYAQARVESGAALEDRVMCGSFSRVEAGVRVEAGQTVVGNPAVRMQSGAGQVEQLRLPWLAASAHVGLVVLHVAWLAGMATVGLHLMLWIGKDDQDGVWQAYARIPVRVLFYLGWMHVMLSAEVVLAKWALVGRATPGRFQLGSVTSVFHLHLHCLDCQMDGLLHTFACGLVLAELYYWLLGVKVELGGAFINSSFFASSDADLVSIRPGAVIDDDAYVVAHEATMGGCESARAFVAAGAVLHPQSGIFRGSVGEGATLFPRSKPLSLQHIPDHQAWIGAPAARAATRPVKYHGPQHPTSDSSLHIPSRGSSTRKLGSAPRMEGSLTFVDAESLNRTPSRSLHSELRVQAV